MRRAKISILIPAKDEANFIGECMDSIRNQSFDEWEAIIVNDNSVDDTNTIVNSYSEKDKRFKLFNNRGKGIIEALRTAFSNASGEYITRMDADDIMYAYKLETFFQNLSQAGKGNIAVGGVNYFSGEKVKSGFQNYEKWLNERTADGTNFKDIFRECPIPSPNWMMHRDDLELINAFEEDRYPEDYDLAFRMFLAGFKVIPCKEKTHHWRDYPSRTSRTVDCYRDHTFTEIKWHYFDSFFRDKSKELVIFGTGARGKKLATHLLSQGKVFKWVSHNPEKIGKHIYDVMIEDLETFQWENKQIVATIAKDIGRNEINKLAVKNNFEIGKDLIHFA